MESEGASVLERAIVASTRAETKADAAMQAIQRIDGEVGALAAQVGAFKDTVSGEFKHVRRDIAAVSESLARQGVRIGIVSAAAAAVFSAGTVALISAFIG